MKTIIFYLALIASAAGILIAITALAGFGGNSKTETAVFLGFMFAVSNAAIAYSVHMIRKDKDIGHKAYPASLVSLLLVILMIYRWWSV